MNEILEIFTGMGMLLMYIALFGIFMTIIGGLNNLFRIRKSQDYRKLICDLYVSAKTKLLAKADGIDLDNEYKDFIKWDKKVNKERRNSNPERDLDNIIESEMKAKVSESINKEIDKISGEEEAKI